MAKFDVPEGWTVQAFQFALDCTPARAACVRRQFGGRRYARNWAVRTLKSDIDAYRATSAQTDKPSFFGMRARWNKAKHTECVDGDTGEVWWPEISKEAFADGIRAAVDGYWSWQQSRSGRRAGKRVGFPRFAKKGRDHDRVTFTTGAIRVESDRRHVTLPRIGCVRVHENTRRLQRLLAKGRARILAVTVSRKGTRLIAAFRVLVQRPQQSGLVSPDSRIGVDVGVRVLATVADSRGHHIHRLTTRLAKTHGEIVVEGLDAAGMLGQKGLTGARARRRGLSDSALSEPRRQLAYKTGWYGSHLVVADRWYPSSKTCHACGNVQEIGWAERWTCESCGITHQRDDNAALNLARYEEPVSGDSVVGPVGAAVKRGADRKTRPSRAGGREARKGRSHTAAEQPRDGVRVA
jgi:putative transposase